MAQKVNFNKGEIPVFLKFQDFPEKIQKSQHIEYLVAEAAIKVVGDEAFRGLMDVDYGRRGERPQIWKLFVWNEVARAKLISSGIEMNGKAINVHNKNPMTRVDDNGEEIKETKLTIGNIPPSFDEGAIETCLSNKGVKFTSRLRIEYIRTPAGKLTDKITGRRTVWIETPEKTLPRIVKMGPIVATLYYREMKKCGNCLQHGHTKYTCKNKEVCLHCKREGHKREDCIDYLEDKERQEEQEWNDNEEDRRKEEEEQKKGSQDEEARKQKEDELKKKKEEEENIKKLEKELQMKAEEEQKKKIAQEQKKKILEEQKKKIEEQKKKKEEEQRKRKEEEHKKKKAEEKRKKEEEEEQKKKEGEEEEQRKKEKEEEEQRKKEEEEEQRKKKEEEEQRKKDEEKQQEKKEEDQDKDIEDNKSGNKEEALKANNEEIVTEKSELKRLQRETEMVLEEDCFLDLDIPEGTILTIHTAEEEDEQEKFLSVDDVGSQTDFENIEVNQHKQHRQSKKDTLNKVKGNPRRERSTSVKRSYSESREEEDSGNAKKKPVVSKYFQ